MRNYIFSAYKNGRVLYPKEATKTEEYLRQHEGRFMTEYLVKDGYNTLFRYRFRTCEPTRFADTLEFDIECPRCHDKLRLCGLPLDATAHGLYKCRRCDDEIKRRNRF